MGVTAFVIASASGFDAIDDIWHIPPELLDQGNELCQLLLREQVDLKVETLQLLGSFPLAVLRREHHHRGHERPHARYGLKKGEGRRVEWRGAATLLRSVDCDPDDHLPTIKNTEDERPNSDVSASMDR